MKVCIPSTLFEARKVICKIKQLVRFSEIWLSSLFGVSFVTFRVLAENLVRLQLHAWEDREGKGYIAVPACNLPLKGSLAEAKRACNQ
eukprot:1162069-Pelagomonas_calceolata.AAC.9